MKIVLTGGPAAGKTSCLKYLREFFLEDKVLYVPEVATILLSGGFPAPGRDVSWSLEWQECFQRSVLPVQENMEEIWSLEAKKRDLEMMILDRGMLDGSAFWPGGLNAFSNFFGLNLQEIRRRYMAVIHLESLATANPEKYVMLRDTNPHRFETLEQASRVEMATREAWLDHDAWYFIPSQESPAEKFQQVAEIIRFFLQK